MWPQYQIDFRGISNSPYPLRLRCLSPTHEIPRSVQPISVLMLEQLLEWPALGHGCTVQNFDNPMVHPAEGLFQRDLIYTADLYQQTLPNSPKLVSKSPKLPTSETQEVVAQWSYAPHTVSRLLGLWSWGEALIAGHRAARTTPHHSSPCSPVPAWVQLRNRAPTPRRLLHNT